MLSNDWLSLAAPKRGQEERKSWQSSNFNQRLWFRCSANITNKLNVFHRRCLRRGDEKGGETPLSDIVYARRESGKCGNDLDVRGWTKEERYRRPKKTRRKTVEEDLREMAVSWHKAAKVTRGGASGGDSLANVPIGTGGTKWKEVRCAQVHCPQRDTAATVSVVLGSLNQHRH